MRHTAMAFVDRFDNEVRAGDNIADDGSSLRGEPGYMPYCFRLKHGHANGALAAVTAYRPWWKDLKTSWAKAGSDVNTEIGKIRHKFNGWTLQRMVGAAGKDKRVATHVAMNSGALHIPLGAEEDSFLDYYAKSLLAGHKLYFVEQLVYPGATGAPVFRLFMDLDFKQLKPISGRGVEASGKVCAQVVARFFPGRPSCTIVACTTYKDCTATDPATGTNIKLVKTGVHLYWPAHYVTPLQCLHIRESIVAELQEVFGPRPAPDNNSWEDVVDKSVYGDAYGGRGSGLRMIGSCKTDKCKDCNGKGSDKMNVTCETCNGSRRVDDVDNRGSKGRPYMMFCVLGEPTWVGAAGGPPSGYWQLDDKGRVSLDRSLALEAYYMEDMHQLVRDTKLRTATTEAELDNGFDLPPGAPLYLATAGGKKPGGGTKPQKRAGEKTVDAGDPKFRVAENVIREAFGDLYAHVVVRTASFGPKHGTAQVTGTNCRYCQNIGREHKSNNIYFVFELVTSKKNMEPKAVVAQRCRDTGDLTPEMRYGLCKDYTSAPMEVPMRYLKQLWKDAAEGLSAMGPIGALRAAEHSGTYLDGYNMKRLLAMIEQDVKKLYNTSFIAAQGLHGQRGSNAAIKSIAPVDARDLGSKGLQAYSDLGFRWADEMLAGATQPADEAEAVKPLGKTLDGLQKSLLKAMATITALASTVLDPDIFKDVMYMDDFLRPSDAAAADGADCTNHDDMEMPDEEAFEAGERAAAVRAATGSPLRGKRSPMAKNDGLVYMDE